MTRDERIRANWNEIIATFGLVAVVLVIIWVTPVKKPKPITVELGGDLVFATDTVHYFSPGDTIFAVPVEGTLVVSGQRTPLVGDDVIQFCPDGSVIRGAFPVCETPRCSPWEMENGTLGLCRTPIGTLGEGGPLSEEWL